MYLVASRVLFVLLAAALTFIPLNSLGSAGATAAVQCKVWVSSLSGGTVSIFDTWTSTTSALVVSQSPVQELAYNRSGTKIFATTFGAGVKIIDLANQVVSDVVIGNQASGDFRAIAVSPISDRIIVGTDIFPPPNQNNFIVLHSDTGATISTIPGTNRAHGIVMTPDGTALAPLVVFQANPADGDIQKIDIGQAVITQTAQFALPANEYFFGQIVATPSGQPSRLYVSSSEGLVKVINPVDMTLVATINTPNPGALATSRQGDRVFAASFSSNSVQVINTSTNQVTNSINVGNGPGSLAVTPDGQYLYVTNLLSNSLSRINLETYVVETVSTITLPTSITIGPPGCTATQPQATATTQVEVPSPVTPTSPPQAEAAPSQQLPATGNDTFNSLLFALFMFLIGASVLGITKLHQRQKKVPKAQPT